MSNESPAPDTREILRLFYQDHIDRVRDIKQQQWNLTYYTILLYAGLIGIHRLTDKFPSPSSVVNHAVLLTAIAIGLASIVLLIYFQYQLRQYRERMQRMNVDKDLWPTEAKKVYGDPQSTYISFAYQLPIFFLKIAVAFVGAAFVVWIAWPT